MKIAVIDPAAYSLEYDVPLCESLAAAGHDVTLYTATFAHGPMPVAHGYRQVEWFYQRRVPGLRRRHARALQHPFDMWRLRRELVREGYDVVHVQWSVVDRFDVPFWRRLPLPVVFTAHNALPREGGSESLSGERLRAFDAVVAHSAWGAAGLGERYDLPRLWHVPIGSYDAYAAQPDPPEPPVALSTGPVVALTGLLRPYKGVDVLLAAWPQVREIVPDAQLVIAGRPMGIALPAHPPDGAQVLPRFLSEQEYAWLLRRADLVCLPYTAIDLSGVLFSAIALGKPMLLSDAGGFAEFVGQGAELVAPGDIDALAAAIARLLRDPARLAELAAEAQRAADEVYSWEAIAARYSQLYPQLLADLAHASRGA